MPDFVITKICQGGQTVPLMVNVLKVVKMAFKNINKKKNSFNLYETGKKLLTV